MIDTASFLADGLTNVAARIRYLFSRLMALDSAVIIFDEIEEFCLDRETPGLSMESRMLTTAMLTAINDLRRSKRSIFFIATNRLRAFDAAITRRGRFDMQLFVGAPNLASRLIQLQQKLSGLGLSQDEKQSAIQSYREFLQEVWTKDAMFMTYLEGNPFPCSFYGLYSSLSWFRHNLSLMCLSLFIVPKVLSLPQFVLASLLHSENLIKLQWQRRLNNRLP